MNNEQVLRKCIVEIHNLVENVNDLPEVGREVLTQDNEVVRYEGEGKWITYSDYYEEDIEVEAPTSWYYPPKVNLDDKSFSNEEFIDYEEAFKRFNVTNVDKPEIYKDIIEKMKLKPSNWECLISWSKVRFHSNRVKLIKTREEVENLLKEIKFEISQYHTKTPDEDNELWTAEGLIQFISQRLENLFTEGDYI